MKRCTLLVAMMLETLSLEAQTGTSAAASWMAHSPSVPAFRNPSTRAEWERRRGAIRAQLSELLGQLPSRPKVPAVQTLAREDRGEYVFESFRFDNGAGATVPGVLLLPKGRDKASPGILYCHWHGGEYDKGKIRTAVQANGLQRSGPKPR